MLLHFLRWLRENASVDFDVLLKEGGALEADFAEVCSVRHLQPGRNELLTPLSRLVARFGTDDAVAWAGSRPWYEREVLRRLHAENGRRRRKYLGDFSKYSLIYLNSVPSVAALRWIGDDVPVLTHIHELGYGLLGSFWANDVDVILHRSRRIVAASGAVAAALVGDLNVDKRIVDVCHEFIPTGRHDYHPERGLAIRRELNIAADAFVIGGGGTLEWRKGPDLFLQLAGSLIRQSPETPAHFIWIGGRAGTAELFQMQHDVERMGLSGRVSISGQTDRPADFMCALDAFALTSRSDPYPLMVLEAGDLGKPFICFDRSGGMPELALRGAGHVVPFGDVAAMAESLVQWYLDPHALAKAGSEVQRIVRQKHDVEVGARRLMASIRRCLSS